MASYPQQFSAGVFYVPPPETQGNAFAALWHGWHQVRSPYAQALFKARLAALDPTAQYRLLENLYERRAQMLEQAASIERAQMQSQSNAQAGSDRRYAAWISAMGSMQSAYYQYRGARERGELDLQGEMMKAGAMNDAARGYLEEYQKSVDAVATAANQGRADDAVAAMDTALTVAQRRIESLRATDPMQADTLARAVRGTQLPINDGELEQALNAGVEASIPSAPNYSVTQPGRVGAPAPLPFWDPAQPAATASPNGSGQAPPPATGRQPVSTGGGTTAPAPSSAAPAATSPLGSTASSTSVRVSGPTSPITAQLLAAANELSGDTADVRRQIPDVRGELGGFYDPIPGAPVRGQRRASETIARDLMPPPPGRSMQAAAAPAPRPTFAPLPTAAPSGTVAAKGEPAATASERAPRGPGGVASDGAARTADPAGSPAPAPAPKPTTQDPFGLLRPAVPPPGQAAPAQELIGPPPVLTRDEYARQITERDLFGLGSGAPPAAPAPAAPAPARAQPKLTPQADLDRARAVLDDPAQRRALVERGPAPPPPQRWGQEYNRAWYSYKGPFTEFSPLWDEYAKRRADDPYLTWEQFLGSR